MKEFFFVIGSLEKGGAEYVMSKLINHYSRIKNCTLILTSNDNIYYNLNNNVKVEYIGSSHSLLKIIKLRKLVKRKNPDVIVSFLTNVNILTLLSLIGYKLRKIVCERGDLSKYFFLRLISVFTYFLADYVVYQTNESKKKHKLFFANKIKKIVIPNYVESTKLTEKTNFNLITCSRFIPSKNIIELIDIYKLLISKGFKDKLFIYGEGPEENRIKKYIKKNKLQNRVLIKPWNNDLNSIFNNSSIYCSTSLEEGFPNSVLNAISFGLVSIAYNSSFGFKDLMSSTLDQTLVRTGEKLEFCEKVFRLTNIEFFEIIRERQIDLVKKNFLKSQIIKKWDNLLCT